MATWEAGTNDSVSRGKVAFDMYVVSTDQGNNRSLMHITIGIFDNNGSYGGYGTGSWSIGLAGGQVASGSVSYDFSGSGPGWIWSGDFWVGHYADGTRYIDGWASFSGSSPVGSATASGGFWLTDFTYPPAQPGAPTLTRSTGSQTVTVTSQAPGSAVGISDYNWRSSTDNVNWTGAQGMGTGRVATFTGAQGVTYYVQTRAGSSEGWGAWSSSSAIYVPAVPGSPGTITANRVGRTVTVTCGTASNGGATISGYYAQYSIDGGATWSSPTWMNSQTVVFENLAPAKTYIFRAYAVNEMGNGATVATPGIWVSFGGKTKVGSTFKEAQNVRVKINDTTYVEAAQIRIKKSDGTWVAAL